MSVSVPGRFPQIYDPCNHRTGRCVNCSVRVRVCVCVCGGRGVCRGKEKHFAHPVNRTPFLRSYSPPLVTVLTGVSGLFIGNQSK